MKFLWHRLINKFFIYRDSNPLDAYRGFLLSLLALGLAGLMVVVTVGPFLGAPRLLGFPANIMFCGGFLWLYVVVRLGFIRLAALAIPVSVAALGLAMSLPVILSGLVLALTIPLAGLLLDRRIVWLVAIITATIWSLTSQFSLWLTLGVIGLYLALAVVVFWLSQLAKFALHEVNSYALQLDEVRHDLEAEVTATHEAWDTSLTVIDQFSQIAATYHRLDSLLSQTGQLLQNKLGFKQIYFFRYYADKNELHLAYSSTKTEPTDKQAIQAAIADKRLVVFTSQGVTPDDFRVQMALPLQRGLEIIGGLQAQANSPTAFNDTTTRLLTVLAKQLAMAMLNIQSTAEAETALKQVEALNRRLIQQKWEQTLQAKKVAGYLYTPEKIEPSNQEWLPSMTTALAADASETKVYTTDSSNDVAIPLRLRGELIGVLGMERTANQKWNEDELSALQTIAEQITLALESARLFENTQRNAWRDQMISESTAKVWASNKMEEVMRAAVAQLGYKLQASEVIIQLDPETLLAETEVV